MFNKKTMVLYCGGAPSIAPNAPTSPAAGGVVGGSGGGTTTAAAAASEPRRPALPSMMGVASPWGSNGLSEGRGLIGGPLPLIGHCEGPPRALIGSGAEEGRERPQPPFWSPAPSSSSSLSLEAEEIDGCEADSDSEAVVVPEMEAKAGEGAASPPPSPELPQDELRKVTLAVVGRYLREAADGRSTKGGVGLEAAAGVKGPFSLQSFLGRFGSGGSEAEAARALETLRRVGESILERHQVAFQGMLRKMEIKKEEDLKSISEVATEVFRDGIINWGRIVTLISFGAFVAKHLKSINQENGINTLIEIITDVLVTDKREWLVKHDAWEGFVKFFHVEDIEGGLRNVLVAFASIAGIGASLAYMIR
ncbi:induced myeloid leukemia cell differentiation protein Mcl-1 [Sceloporus undulatus]|uniref:induced myeloid leukemia cell differentiation protein Mcl-1 n=1 Tax=Sceloporus undulatus TaxID=8520 RepID=UPI001C4D5DDD|nr:induced myeloid leukemia cell differentiation protein Mcl-1 [Sceloporus undulatus]